MKAKTKIIPAIDVKTKKELEKEITLVSFVDKVHIDIMDGRFVPTKTITAKEVNGLKKTPKLQIHLMSFNVIDQLKKFKHNNIVDFIFHVESEKELENIISEIKKRKLKAGIAFNPKTNVEKYKKALKKSDLALVMTVNPGFSGQKMIFKCLNKVSQIKKINKKIYVGVDGGVNQKDISKVRIAGCSFAAVTSAIFNSKNVKKSFKKLNN